MKLRELFWGIVGPPLFYSYALCWVIKHEYLKRKDRIEDEKEQARWHKMAKRARQTYAQEEADGR